MSKLSRIKIYLEYNRTLKDIKKEIKERTI